ncbi:MAG: hypothetical protein A2201_07280 [Alicyclobacillus sp. RIFOXYA1_FULL_53_8]|nr:MAG: hypothetical protein A2201_07280 [Alicyclobacillus sp. RIFOXYA1_FULL_53_8]
MSLFARSENLYRIEIVEQCPANTFWRSVLLGGGFGRPRGKDSFKRGSLGFFPVGLTGWVVSRNDRKYFEPDADQDGLDLFMDPNQPYTYFPYSLVAGHYKVIG